LEHCGSCWNLLLLNYGTITQSGLESHGNDIAFAIGILSQ
jgi:hypothetical protein